MKTRVNSILTTIVAFALPTIGALLHAATDTRDTSADFYLKNGDRVVFYGDSITDQRLYTTFTETYVVTRFPSLDVKFIHSGWGSDRVTGGYGGNVDTRLERDVFAWNPTVVSIMLGMNDGQQRAFDQSIFDAYTNGLTSMVEKIEQRLPNTRITLIRPSPYDDVTRAPRFPGGYNEVMRRYGDAVEKLASKANRQVADFNTPLIHVLQKAKSKNADLSLKILGDRVHPSAAGHLVMAASLLEAWRAPSLVAAVAIDASSGKARVINEQNTTITNLTDREGLLSWTQTDRALPLPINLDDSLFALVIENSDIIQKLNQQPLRISGLTAPQYVLKIDNESIGIFSAKQMEDGLNLATLSTPMQKQARKVHALTLKRAETHQTRWRSIQVPYAAPNSKEMAESMPKILSAFDAEVEALRELQHRTAQPKPHKFEVIPQAIGVSLPKTTKADSFTSSPTASAYGTAPLLLPDDLGPNLALNKPWVSSAPNSYGWDRGLTDGSWETKRGATYATNNSENFPKTVTVDLEKLEKNVTCIAIGVPPYGSTKNVAVSLSQDGNNFREVGRHMFSQELEEKRIITFDPTDTRFIRLTYEDYYPDKIQYDSGFMFTTDLQAYSKAN